MLYSEDPVRDPSPPIKFPSASVSSWPLRMEGGLLVLDPEMKPDSTAPGGPWGSTR